uniref:Uncharacterized protein n=1 Tax=Romanomermis culicivorax TaxID=13658 RepID=A0A915JPQ7_ROMCU
MLELNSRKFHQDNNFLRNVVSIAFRSFRQKRPFSHVVRGAIRRILRTSMGPLAIEQVGNQTTSSSWYVDNTLKL